MSDERKRQKVRVTIELYDDEWDGMGTYDPQDVLDTIIDDLCNYDFEVSASKVENITD